MVCGQRTNNSLSQKHFRKQEELSVSRHVFAVPINHLSEHVHKQTDARGRKSGHTAPALLKQSRCSHNPVTSARPCSQPCKLGKARTPQSKTHKPKKAVRRAHFPSKIYIKHTLLLIILILLLSTLCCQCGRDTERSGIACRIRAHSAQNQIPAQPLTSPRTPGQPLSSLSRATVSISRSYY